jgi:hypothetical protein
MYSGPVPRFKILSPYPDLRFDGSVDVDGERWEVARWPGMQGHNWGRAHSVRYAWAHCNAFDDAPAGTWFEGFTGQVKLGPLRTPPGTMIGLSLGGPLVRFTDLRGIFRRRGEVSTTGWSFAAEAEGHSVEGDVVFALGEVAGLRYENPAGPVTNCLNGKLARMEVRHQGPSGRTTTLTSRAAALEIGTHDTDHGIQMIL